MSRYYWHSIGSKICEGDPSGKQRWWDYLVDAREISAGYENNPEKGEAVLRQYAPEDVVIAYAPGFGAVGYGVIESPDGYFRVGVGEPKDVLGGMHLHRLPITWKAVIRSLSQAIPASFVKEQFGIYHSISASKRIADEVKARRLIEYLHANGEKLV
jgi:hypothetical protein